jgi:predicted nucleotidyltransferase component of viral defense system
MTVRIARDHLLVHFAREGFYELSGALKKGTVLRRFWAGDAGRFSKDLDF